VIIGSMFLKHLITAGSQQLLNALLGAILVGTAGSQLIFHFRNAKRSEEAPDRSHWMPWLMLPVGAEVGFSSAGAGLWGRRRCCRSRRSVRLGWWGRILPSASWFR